MVLTVLILLLVAATLVALVYPFWRGDYLPLLVGQQALEDQDRLDLELEKRRLIDSLQELDLEFSQGRVGAEDHRRLRLRDERRLREVSEALEQAGRQSAGRPGGRNPSGAHIRWVASAFMGIFVATVSAAIYAYWIGHYEDQVAQYEALLAAQQTQPQMPDPREMVRRLEARLRENPDDLQGQVMAGRSYMALGRLEDARQAWDKVLELDPRNHEGHFYTGLLMMQTRNEQDPEVFEKALDHFERALLKVPRDPAVLFYKGVALVHLRRFSEADESWTQAYQNLMPGSEDAEFVKKALQSLREGRPLEF